MTVAFYGQSAEIRVGRMATPQADPTAWENLEFVSLNVSPGRPENERPLIGVPLHNRFDARETEAGITSLTAELVVPVGSVQLARWLFLGLGVPSSAPAGQAGLFAHTWTSGLDPVYFALQVRTGAAEVRVYRGLTLSAIAIEAQGEQVANFDATLSLVGLSEELRADWLGAAATAPAIDAQSSAIRRMVFRVNGNDAVRVQSAGWTYDRQATPDTFLSRDPQPVSVTPEGGAVTGQAQFRSMGAEYDALERGRTVFAAALEGVGRIANHKLELIAPAARFQAAPVAIDGPGQVSRTWSWRGHQTASAPAGRIVLTNAEEDYLA